MTMNGLSFFLERIMNPVFIAKAIVILLCLPAHECAHAWTANILGDSSGKRLGRVTLNPLKHLDIWGAVMLLTVGVGYAKPVPVNERNFTYPRRDLAIVSISGPLVNYIMGNMFLVMGYAVNMLPLNIGYDITTILDTASICFNNVAYFNFGLAIFNMIPIPPFDGYKVLISFLPTPLYKWATGLEKYSSYTIMGMFIAMNVFKMSLTGTMTQWLYNSADVFIRRIVIENRFIFLNLFQ